MTEERYVSNLKSFYHSIGSFDELLDTNVDFIEGKIKWTPYHQKEYTPGPLKQDLIKINKLGFLTLGGQCAEDTPTQEKKLFLDGYLKVSLIRNFIKYLKKFPKIEYFIELPDNLDSKNQNSKEIKTNIRDWHNEYNIKENQSVYFNSLVRVKKSPSDKEWINTDILPFRDISYITLNFWKGFDNIIKILKDYAFVHIQHRSFHNTNNDLYTIINGYLSDSKNKLSDQKGYKPKKSKKEKKNHFGKSKHFGQSLSELKRDLKLLSLNSFGVKRKKKFLNEGIKHIKKHKWKYITAIGISGIKYSMKNKFDKLSSKRKEERLRKIIREELRNK